MADVGPTLTTTAPVRDRFLEEFHALAELELNLRPITFAQAAADPDWNLDHRRDVLAREQPGPPEPRGAYATARQALIDYAFADPRLVRAVYDPTVPLEGRDMLLVGHFYGLRFPMGVRSAASPAGSRSETVGRSTASRGTTARSKVTWSAARCSTSCSSGPTPATSSCSSTRTHKVRSRATRSSGSASRSSGVGCNGASTTGCCRASASW